MFSRFLTALLSMALLGGLVAIGIVVAGIVYFNRDLPDYTTLAHYEPPIVTRAYASDGRLLAEFATEKRVYVRIESVPPLVIGAFLSAEDKNFYKHSGVDPVGIARALLSNVRHIGSGQRPHGASTITQQVAKNFLLSSEVSYVRKIKEMLLSFRIEQTYSKSRILELYLNEIYLGSHAYGVAAASLEYFNKPLEELTPEEAAFLASLPKAPNNYQPDRHYKAALARRNWVLSEMASNGYLMPAEAAAAQEKPIQLIKRTADEYVHHPYFAEEVRRKLQELYGDKGLYEGGMIANTSLIPAYQKIAEHALRRGLMTYDMRHGLHSKPLAHLDVKGDWATALTKVTPPVGRGDLELAVVLEMNDKRAVVGLMDGRKAVIPFAKMSWARSAKDTAPTRVRDVLKTGDVWLAENLDSKEKDGFPTYGLRQIPSVSGGMIAMDPHTGRIFALVGGFSYEMSEFDRAFQAQRQPGSAFKPFVYITALANGFTPATLVLDAPIELDQGPGLPKWRPKNYHEGYNGPTPMRVGLEKSLNLMTIRLANYVGMNKLSETVKQFGVVDDLPPYPAFALGAADTTLLRMVAGYSIFVNGGKKVVPTLIDRIQDRDGKTVYVHDPVMCEACGPLVPWKNQETPTLPDPRMQIADPRHAYQMVSMMEGVVQRGTARDSGLKDLGYPVAGKTGTTNDSKDAWFIGFTPDLVVGAYIGFDEPRSLGAKETGGRIAAPIVKDFFEQALKDVSPVPFRMPPGIRLVEIDRATGTRAQFGQEDTLLEAFIEGTEPTDQPMMFNGKDVGPAADVTKAGEGADTGLGGLY